MNKGNNKRTERTVRYRRQQRSYLRRTHRRPPKSDGLVEAHDPERQIFGFPTLRALVAEHDGEEELLVNLLLEELYAFAGEGWEQEDDITLLTLERFEPPS